MAGYVSIIAGTGGIIGQDIDATIKQQMHMDADNLGKGLVALVDILTPVLTGALLMDMSYDIGAIWGPDDIVFAYAESVAQEAYWNRVYVAYQEGGQLGLPTYTNDPHQMFLDTAEGPGLALTETWAMTNVLIALARCRIGAGVPI
jgi:hypothetical protein